MKRLRLRWPRLLVVLLAAGAWGHAGAADRVVIRAAPLPTAQEIVARAVADDTRRHEQRLSMECDQFLSTQHFDEQGALTKTKTAHVVHREGAEFASLAEDGSLAAHLAVRDGDTRKAEHRLATMNLARLAPRFDYALVEEAPLQGRTCYVVAFTPKKRGQPADSKEEKAINALHGRLWIDEKTYEIVQGEGALVAPVSVGLLAAVKAMSISFHNAPLVSGELGPADFTVDYSVKAPFYFFRQRQENQFQNWRPVAN